MQPRSIPEDSDQRVLLSLRRLDEQATARWRTMRQGIALVLSFLFPGLGHMFLLSGWSVVYLLIYTVGLYMLVPRLVFHPFPFLWLIVVLGVWIGAMIHAHLLAEED